jgi:hypothetical protein
VAREGSVESVPPVLLVVLMERGVGDEDPLCVLLAEGDLLATRSSVGFTP